MSKTKSNAPAVAEEDNWRARHDLQTLVEADRIRKDSKRMKAVREEAKRQRDALSKVDAATT